MRAVNAFLLISARNFNDRFNPKIVWPLPTLDVHNLKGRVYWAVMNLLLDITKIEAFNGVTGWATVNPGQIYDDPELTSDVWLPYGTAIPDTVPLKDGYVWKSIEDIYKDDSISKLDKKLVFSTGVNL